MPNKEIRKQCYELLWELFGDKCPYIMNYILEMNTFAYQKSPEYYYPSEDSKKRTYDTKNIVNPLDPWTILTEILPHSIIEKSEGNNNYIWGFIFRRGLDRLNETGEIFAINYEGFSFYSLVGWNGLWANDFWQALLNLLEAIKSHPEFGKMEFVYGKEQK